MIAASGRSVLVTGASGLVGRRVMAGLAAHRDQFRALVALDLHDPPATARQDGVTYARRDIRDPAIADVLVSHDIDTVVHLAAIVTPGKHSSRSLERSIDVDGTRNVVGACLRSGVKLFVYTSSGAAYGFHADNPAPLREEDALRGNPEFAYADHKRLVEEMLADFRERHPGLGQLVFRPGTILGANVASPISAMFERPVIAGLRGVEIPFVLVWDEDVAACIVRGVLERRTGVYNLAGDGAITLREIARRLGKPYVALPSWLMRRGLDLLHRLGLSERGGEQVDFLAYRPVLDNTRLKTEFGFLPSDSSEGCFERWRRAKLAAGG